uniref:FAS1 domain-containing protein n=1 Tax=Aegilops tauschii subsp. strangulata TaxID=200361 RepID=A0A453F786_AEGTS
MAARSGIVVVAAALLALVAVSQAQAPGPSATPAGPPNVTAILVKGGQYTTFMRLMKETQQDTQLNSQLNNSFNGNGYTVFAPTDNAFNNLKPGTLNSLTQQQQVSLVQAHILPQYYTMESFQTASNPVRTQASGEKEPITVNIVASNNQVNVTTGRVRRRSDAHGRRGRQGRQLGRGWHGRPSWLPLVRWVAWDDRTTTGTPWPSINVHRLDGFPCLWCFFPFFHPVQIPLFHSCSCLVGGLLRLSYVIEFMCLRQEC